jgi:hypothetical protein
MRWLAVVSVLALLGLAGCSGPASHGDEALEERTGRTARGADEATGGHFDATFTLQIRPKELAGTVCVSATCLANANCIYFFEDPDEKGFTLSNGTVDLTWTAATPLAEELGLVVSGSEELADRGPSPLSVQFDALASGADIYGVSFAVDHDYPNVPANQEVALHIVFDYEGAMSTAVPTQCSDLA